MQVLIIGQYYPPDVGGSHRRTFNAVQGLERRGHHVQIVTAFPHYPAGNIPTKYKRKLLLIETEGEHRIIRVWIPSISHHGFTRRLLMYVLFSITALMALPLTKRADIIWAASPSVFSSFPASVFSFFKRAPVVRNVDDLWPETALQLGVLNPRLKRIGEFFARVAYALGSTLTPISRAYSKTLVHKYGVPKTKIHVAEVGVDIAAFSRMNKSAGRENGIFTILYSGLLGVGYDFDTVIQAAHLLQKNKEIRFHIRGVGEMEGWIRKEVVLKNLTNVTVSSEFLEQTKLVELLTNADALLLPMKPTQSSDMGVPTKLFEYMACGRPIVCCSAGESARIVEKANCGIVVHPGNAESLAKAISSLAKSAKSTELGLNGRKYAEEHFSIDCIAFKLERAFEQAIAA